MVITRWLKVATVLAALGAAGSGVGVGLLAQEGKPGNAPKPTEKPQAVRPDDASAVRVTPGKLTVTKSGRGNLEASQPRDVLCEIELGTTTIIMIRPEGTQVKQGEVVAELDSAWLRDTLVNRRIATQQAEANFKQARLVREVAEYAVKEFEQGILPGDRETYKGKIADAESGIQKAEARLGRTRRARRRFDEALGLNKEPSTPADIAADLTIDAHLDDAESDLSKQKRNLVLAKSELEFLEKFTKEKQTRQLSGDVEKAKADELGRLSSLNLERTKERSIERQISKCTLNAPSDGIVIYANEPPRAGAPDRVQIGQGATVRNRQKIFSVFARDDPMRINAKIPEGWIDKVRPGQSARIRVDAMANDVLTGTVAAVAPMADPSFADAKVYSTFIVLEKGPPGLRPGLSAQAEILIKELDNVLTVPVTSVVEFADGKDQVAVRTPGGAVEWREVTLGASDDKVVEVKQGLRPGDLVVQNPVAHLSEEKRREVRWPPKAPESPSTRPGTP